MQTFFSVSGPDLAVADLIHFLSLKSLKLFKGHSKVLLPQNLSDLITVNHFSGPNLSKKS